MSIPTYYVARPIHQPSFTTPKFSHLILTIWNIIFKMSTFGGMSGWDLACLFKFVLKKFRKHQNCFKLLTLRIQQLLFWIYRTVMINWQNIRNWLSYDTKSICSLNILKDKNLIYIHQFEILNRLIKSLHCRKEITNGNKTMANKYRTL